MEKQAIIIVYSGIEPDRDTVRAAVEAVAKGVHMDTQTMEVTVLNDKEIAQAIVAKTLKSNVYVENPYNATQRVVLEMKSDGYTPEKEAVVLTNKYISCVVSGIETELSRAMNTLYDSPSKLEIIKQIKDQTGWGLAEVKDLVDLIFSTIQSCRGRFGK
jgi:ribosomal protein L7/L12